MKIRKFHYIVIFWGLISLVLPQVNIYEMQAIYIEKIIRFVEWPRNNKQVFTIGYFKEDHFLIVLRQYYQKILIQDKPVQFILFDSNIEFDQCDLLYMPKLSRTERLNILDRLAAKPVLIVSQTKDYARYGTHVNFYMEDNKLKFEINVDAFKSSDLKVSHHLLQLAKIIPPEGAVK